MGSEAGLLLRLKDFRPRRQGWIGQGIDLTLREGETAVIVGGSGSGKTSMLLALAGLIPHEGHAEFLGKETASLGKKSLGPHPHTVYVPEEPEKSLVATFVADEVAFGPENLCLDPQEVSSRVREALETVGLLGSAWSKVATLSAGQKQRLALSNALAMKPSLLLLDNIFATIDPPSRRLLTKYLNELTSRGLSVILASFVLNPEGLQPDHTIELGPREAIWSGYDVVVSKAHDISELETEPVLHASGVWFSYPDGEPVIRGVSLEAGSGEVLVLMGRNGVGKSTLLKVCTGLLKPSSGVVTVKGSKPKPGQCVYIHQNPSLQLLGRTPLDDLNLSLAQHGSARDEAAGWADHMLGRLRLAKISDRPIHDLSLGEKRLVSIASGLALKPKLLAVDEPTSGLDKNRSMAVGDILKETASRGIAVIVASHDERFALEFADRCIVLRDGVVAYDGKVRRSLVE